MTDLTSRVLVLELVKKMYEFQDIKLHNAVYLCMEF